jgi:hypothetical protein
MLGYILDWDQHAYQIGNGKYLTYLREEGDAIQEAK